MVSDATRIRVLRALIGATSKEFAARVGVTPGVITSWEKGRATPQRDSRRELSKICQEENIMLMPSGMPVPAEDLLPKQEKTNAGESNLGAANV
jgi:transcriptional regulator with XRE-family HTH domain